MDFTELGLVRRKKVLKKKARAVSLEDPRKSVKLPADQQGPRQGYLKDALNP